MAARNPPGQIDSIISRHRLSLATLACGPLQTSFGERGYLAMAALAALGLALALGLGRALRRAGDPRAS